MSRSATDKRIDDLLASGVTLRFTGRCFENAHTPGKGETFKLQDVLCRVYAGRGAIVSPFADERTGHEILVTAPPKRSERAL
jgi:hypothetical protein